MNVKKNQTICPLCGHPNHCAKAEGKDIQECWCFNVQFPKEIFELIPEGKTGCICQNCLKTLSYNYKHT
jgi:hypothetical protein